jgi:hypothetical protein
MVRDVSLAACVCIALAGCSSLGGLVDAASFQTDPRSRYVAPKRVPPLEIFVGPSPLTAHAKSVLATRPDLATKLGGSDCTPEARQSTIRVERFGPATLGLVVAGAGIVFDIVADQVKQQLDEYAASFVDSKPAFANVSAINQLPANTCLLIIRSGRARDASTDDPDVATLILALRVVSVGTNGRSFVPLWAEVPYAHVRTRNGGGVQLNVEIGVAVEGSKDGAPVLRDLGAASMLVRAGTLGSGPIDAQQLALAQTRVIPAPPPSAGFGVIALSIAEEGEGAEAFALTAKLVEANRKAVRDMLTSYLDTQLGR